MKRLIILITVVFLLSSIYAQNSFSLFKSHGKYGIINADKEIIVSANYDEIQINDVIFCRNNSSESVVYDDDFIVLHRFNDDEKKIKMISPDLFYYSRGEGFYEEKYLYSLSKSEEKLTNFRWNEGNNKDEPWIAYKTGFSSKTLQEEKYSCHHAYPYRNNRALVLNYEREGEIIDENFNTIASKIFAAADYYSENLIPVIMLNSSNTIGKSCYLDLDGNIVHECEFNFNFINRDEINEIQVPEVIGSFNENAALVQTDKKNWLIMDKNFNFIELNKNYSPKSKFFSNNLLLISDNENGTERFGFIDRKAELVIPFEYNYAESFLGNYAVVEKDGISGIIDFYGEFTATDKLK